MSELKHLQQIKFIRFGIVGGGAFYFVLRDGVKRMVKVAKRDMHPPDGQKYFLIIS